MQPKSALITVIIPVRLSEDRLYNEVERIERIIAILPETYVALIVDYGTGLARAGELRDVAAKCGVELVRVETGQEPFSVGAARDIGTQYAKTPLVMYHDIDFLMSRETYIKVVAECRLRDMPGNAYAFFALPGAYLTEEFTSHYLDLLKFGDGYFADILVHDGLMRCDKTVYEGSTYAISAIVANRYHLLAIGGHDKSFKGHGAEDFELMHRLTSYYLKGPRTKDYYKNTKNNSILSYEGFRAYYALYGIELFQRGIVIAHLWHPRRRDVGYVGTNNQARVSAVMTDYDQGRSFLMPLEDETSAEKTLVLVNPGTSPAQAIRYAYPAFGKYQVIPESNFPNAASLIDFIDSEGFTRVFMLNPYGNDHRLLLYRGIKAAGKCFIAYDRGAYNDSWFFDTRGFLGESTSYAPELWDKPLSNEDRTKVDAWIADMRLSEETLEQNGARVGCDNLRQSLQIGGRKVLFVALQRPNDTATVHFAGPCIDPFTFNTWISKLSAGIDKRKYVVVVKKHPLETSRPNIDDVYFASDETHISDLIDLADKVIVINSGTGLISLTQGKPVICCGQSFYCHPGLAWQARNPDELLALAQSDLVPDLEKRTRFVRYLTQEFYSFGKSKYIAQSAIGGSRIVNKTMFSVIRGLTPDPIQLGAPPSGISLDAPLFYSFGGRQAIKAIPSVKNAVPAAPKAVPAAPKAVPAANPVKQSPSALEFMKIGAKAFHKKDYTEAAKNFEQACVLSQTNPGYMRSAAEAHFLAGDTKTALSFLDKAIAISPKNKSITRRKKEMTRSQLLRKVLGEKPFPVMLS